MCGHSAHGADDARLDTALGALVAALVLAAGPAPARLVGRGEDCRRLVHGSKARGWEGGVTVVCDLIQIFSLRYVDRVELS